MMLQKEGLQIPGAARTLTIASITQNMFDPPSSVVPDLKASMRLEAEDVIRQKVVLNLL